jgi:hypothetical protein
MRSVYSSAVLADPVLGGRRALRIVRLADVSPQPTSPCTPRQRTRGNSQVDTSQLLSQGALRESLCPYFPYDTY